MTCLQLIKIAPMLKVFLASRWHVVFGSMDAVSKHLTDAACCRILWVSIYFCYIWVFTAVHIQGSVAQKLQFHFPQEDEV
ncbi:MAG: hypothetical protein CM15mP62_30270 [Rhodospirillaceae bacterium]|nr:MAG: hypothetical protein CM15mP62_30270 [Rhodospirillaceae bacterium]